MRENQGFFNQLRADYPDGVSKEQFYKIAHISKATARYLLDSGKVPCLNTGKKTHRYLIMTEDVIRYLKDREKHPDRYMVIDGWYSKRSGVQKEFVSYRGELRKLSKKQIEELQEHIDSRTSEYDDLLDVKSVSKITGYSCSTICRWCEQGRLKSFRISGTYRIPKEWLVNFLSSEFSGEIVRKSRKHLEIIKSFLKKQGAV